MLEYCHNMIHQWIVFLRNFFNDLNGFHAAGNQAIVVVAEDTDVFAALLLHYCHSGMIKGGNVYMQYQ